MAITFTLTDLRTNSEFDMRPNPSSNPAVMLVLDSLQMFSRDKQPLWHTGADGRQRLIQCHEGARGVSFDLIFRGSRDTAYNNLIRLNRWLEMAIESELNPQNSWPVYLKVKLEGATSATIHRVQFGVTDPSSAILNAVTAVSGVDAPLWTVGVALVLYPYGRSAQPYYLNNALHNGAFDRWNAAEDEPYGWSNTSAGGVLAKATFKKLVGRFSCRVTTDANGAGLRADAVPVPAYHLALASAWVIIESGTWELQIFKGTGNGTEVISVSGLTAAVLAANTGNVVQDTAIDEAGNTWYQIRIAQVSEDATQTMFVRWVQDGAGTGVSWIDAAQLRTVEAENRFQDPHMVHFDRNVWGDFLLLDGDNHTVAGKDTDHHFDNDGEFVTTASGLVVTFDTSTSALGLVKTRVLTPSRQGDTWLCRFWMRFVGDQGTTLRVQLRDGADNVLDTVDITEETIGDVDTGNPQTGGDAATWYLIELTGTNSSAPGVYAIWYPTATGSGQMSFYLDELYIYGSTGPTFHGAFISDWRLENRNDFADANETRFNYLHLFNLPGDGPCAIKLRGHVISGVDVARQIWIAAAPETRYPYIQHSYEAETSAGYFSVNTDARWTDTADAAASGGNYNRFLSTSDSDTLGTGRDYIYMSIPTATILEEIHRWGGRPLRVFARARTEHASGEMYFELATQNATVTRANRRQGFTAVDTWEWIDLGPLHLYYTEDGVRTTHNVRVLRIFATANNTYHVDIDKVEFLPVPDGGYGRWRFYEFGTFGQYFLDGLNQEMTYVLDGTEIHTPYSGVYEFMPGHVAHMVIFGTAKATGEHSLTDIIDFTGVEIFPQTTHLLGTI